MGPKKGRPKKSEKLAENLVSNQMKTFVDEMAPAAPKTFKSTRGRPAKKKLEALSLGSHKIVTSENIPISTEVPVTVTKSTRGRGRRKVTHVTCSSLSDTNIDSNADKCKAIHNVHKSSSVLDFSENFNSEICLDKNFNGIFNKQYSSYNVISSDNEISNPVPNNNIQVVEVTGHKGNKSTFENVISFQLNTNFNFNSLLSTSLSNEPNVISSTSTNITSYSSTSTQPSSNMEEVQVQTSLLSPSPISSGDVPLKKRRLRDLVIKDDDGFVVPPPMFTSISNFTSSAIPSNTSDVYVNNSKSDNMHVNISDITTDPVIVNNYPVICDEPNMNKEVIDVRGNTNDEIMDHPVKTLNHDMDRDVREKTKKMLLGAHILYEGDYANAVLRAVDKGYRALSMFIKDQLTWVDELQISDQQAADFKRALKMIDLGCSSSPPSTSPSSSSLPLSSVIARGSCIVNLTSSDDDILCASFDCVVDDMTRCNQLGIMNYCLHLESFDSEKSQAVKQLSDQLNALHLKVPNVVTVIENSCGEEMTLGSSIDEWKVIFDLINDKSRIGFAVDTCHLFSSGIDIREEDIYLNFFETFDKDIGMDYLKVIYLNDSKGTFGSHEDEHASLGDGNIGMSCFKRIINDSRLKNIPMILETPLINHSKDFETILNLIDCY